MLKRDHVGADGTGRTARLWICQELMPEVVPNGSRSGLSRAVNNADHEMGRFPRHPFRFAVLVKAAFFRTTMDGPAIT